MCAYSYPGPGATKPSRPWDQAVYYKSYGFEGTRVVAPLSHLKKRLTLLLAFPLFLTNLFLYCRLRRVVPTLFLILRPSHNVALS